MKKSHGIVSLKKAAKLLSKHAPEGESLAYINPTEGRILKAHGGSGIMTLPGVPSYGWWETVKNIGKYVAPKIIDWWAGDKGNGGNGGGGGGKGGGDQGYTGTGDLEEEHVGTIYDNTYKTPSTPWSDIVTGAKKWATERYSNPANIMRDVATIGTVGYSIYEDFKKGKITKENFERQMAEEAANRAEIQANLGGFSVGAIPEETEIARFTESTGRPDMETNPWAAEGGRIGAFNGGIQGLMPRRGRVTYPGGYAGEEYDDDFNKWGYQDFKIYEKGGGKLPWTQWYQEIYLPMLDEKFGIDFAQGGRIGYFNGGIQGLMPQQGPAGFMPQQGMMPQPGLMPQRLGFEFGSTPEEGDIGFEEEIIHPGTLDEGNIGIGGQPLGTYEHEGALTNEPTSLEQVVELAQAIALPFNPYHIWDTMQKAGASFKEAIEIVKNTMGGETEVTEEVTENKPPEWADDFLEKLNKGEIELPKQNYENEMMPFNVAHGGRIGYAEGSKRTYEDWLKYRIKIIAEGGLPIPFEMWERGDDWEIEAKAQGGRIGAQGGGIMPLLNLGGMEKDYRQEGGFVPIGRKEKADDVPARLSKNEFVFTADAVKAAGGGDIDEGAQRMYNVMKNLEAGGQISQQSQGRG